MVSWLGTYAVLTGLHAAPPAARWMIRQRIEALDDIGAVDEEIRGIVARNWPYLLSKLPPEEE